MRISLKMSINKLLQLNKHIQKIKQLAQSLEKPETGTEETVLPGLSELYCPEKSDKPEKSSASTVHVKDIADILHGVQKITSDQLNQIRTQQKENPQKDITAILQQSASISEQDILAATAELYGLEVRDISAQNINKEEIIKTGIDPHELWNNYHAIPLAAEENEIVIAISDPSNTMNIENLKKNLHANLKIVVCSQQNIEAIYNSFKEPEKSDCNIDDIISDITDLEVVQDQKENIEDLEKMAGQSPVIKFVNYLISNAIHENASDIHIEPKTKFTKIRYRIDGELFETMQSPIKMHPAVVSRIKIMANLDISERRLSQDGKISVIMGGRNVDLRISTLPTTCGEKVVIRVLDSKSILRSLDDLGMESKIKTDFSGQIDMPHGIMLVTGPTGSGKSTTLYTALSQMDGERLNISTVEDPVEYELGFCNQVQVNEKIGLSFASTLRSLLRQDPDIIMVGEIRDNETARIAVQAALTGHLVLSTLHTNDAPSSITRLVDIGIDPYLLAASLNAILAQRLVRKICPKCKKNYEVPANMHQYLKRIGVNLNEVQHGEGCDYCRNSGYVGRIGIYEMLVIDDTFREVINKDPSITNMRQAFIKNKNKTLFDDGLDKIKQGLTTIEEVLRVTEPYSQN